MSWPTDGQPRYVVREQTGYRSAGSGGSQRIGLCVRVVDRGYCYRDIRLWASEKFRAVPGLQSATREQLDAYLRAQASEFAALLNLRNNAKANKR